LAVKPSQDSGNASRSAADSVATAPKSGTGLREPQRVAKTSPSKDVGGTSRSKTDVSTTKKDATASPTSTTSRNARKDARTVSEKDKERSDIASTGTKPAVEKVAGSEPPAVKPPDGSLSVFFLGGVGEFFVNGKRFAQQPPFEKVSIPAGTYRMACRMSGDAAPKEIVVTIRSNQETVIEYEIGRAPVVSTE